MLQIQQADHEVTFSPFLSGIGRINGGESGKGGGGGGEGGGRGGGGGGVGGGGRKLICLFSSSICGYMIKLYTGGLLGRGYVPKPRFGGKWLMIFDGPNLSLSVGCFEVSLL